MDNPLATQFLFELRFEGINIDDPFEGGIEARASGYLELELKRIILYKARESAQLRIGCRGQDPRINAEIIDDDLFLAVDELMATYLEAAHDETLDKDTRDRFGNSVSGLLDIQARFNELSE